MFQDFMQNATLTEDFPARSQFQTTKTVSLRTILTLESILT